MGLLGHLRVPASLLRSRQGLPSPFGQNPLPAPPAPLPCLGHEPVDFMESKLPTLSAAACQVRRPPHSLLCKSIPLLSREVCLRSMGHLRLPCHTLHGGGLEEALLEQGGTTRWSPSETLITGGTGEEGRQHLPVCVVELVPPDKRLITWTGAFGTLGFHSSAMNWLENWCNSSSPSGLSFLFRQMRLVEVYVLGSHDKQGPFREK